MSKRASLLTRVAGVIALIGGVYVAWASWAATATSTSGPFRLLDFAAPGRGIAFADDLAASFSSELALPRLLVTEPLVWLGVALVLAPTVYRRIRHNGTPRDPAYASYAYVECPECRHVVPMSSKCCPLCGAQLFAPWANTSQAAASTPARRG